MHLDLIETEANRYIQIRKVKKKEDKNLTPVEFHSAI